MRVLILTAAEGDVLGPKDEVAQQAEVAVAVGVDPEVS